MIRKIKKLAAYFGFFQNTIEIHGLKFDGVKKSKALQEFYLDNNFEIEMFKLLKEGGYETLIDLGAYFGYFSIFGNVRGEINNVVAYEADPDNYEQLKRYVHLNDANVTIVNKAAGDSEGTVEFFKPIYAGTTKFPAHGQIGDPKLEPGNLYADKKYKKIEVNMDPLSKIVTDHVAGPTLIKIDIEGYEEAALRSIEQHLKNTNSVDLLVEIMINDHNKDSIFDFLRSLRFQPYLLTNAGLVKEDRALTLPKPNTDSSNGSLRTLWKNHFFTKKSDEEVKHLNLAIFKYHI